MNKETTTTTATVHRRLTLRRRDSSASSLDLIRTVPLRHLSPANQHVRVGLPDVFVRHPTPRRVLRPKLAEKLAGDVLIAAAVTAAVTPFLTVVDKALVQRSAGTTRSILASSIETVTAMLKQPASYLRSPAFLWMWMTYASTYTAANVLQTITQHQNHQKLQSKHYQQATLFVGTTAANTTASIIKDTAYARMFGNNNVNKVPFNSYALWLTRDFTVIGSSFLLPEHVAQIYQSYYPDANANTTAQIAQILTPMLAQLVAGPLHYLGLDCYNRPLPHGNLAETALARIQALRNAYVPVVAARMARVLPGYGLAGVWNKRCRNEWSNRLIQREMKKYHEKMTKDDMKYLVELIRTKRSE